MKLTPWFHASAPPARAGWYECRYAHGGLERWYWAGVWRVSPRGPKTHWGNNATYDDNEYWRGLAERPKEKK